MDERIDMLSKAKNANEIPTSSSPPKGADMMAERSKNDEAEAREGDGESAATDVGQEPRAVARARRLRRGLVPMQIGMRAVIRSCHNVQVQSAVVALGMAYSAALIVASLAATPAYARGFKENFAAELKRAGREA